MSENMSQEAIAEMLAKASAETESPEEESASAEDGLSEESSPEDSPSEVEAQADDVLDTASIVDQIIENEITSRDDMLTSEEKDILGEFGNICMGRSATTLYTLLGHRVSITTPNVNVYTAQEILQEYHVPYVVVEVAYTNGIDGRSLLLLKREDAAIITDLLMGGDGEIDPDMELSELHLSAISEVMNQMVGSSATALSELLHTSVNISTPRTIVVRFEQEHHEFELDDSEMYIRIGFRMEIEGYLDSQIMQIMPFSFGNVLIEQLMSEINNTEVAPVSDTNVQQPTVSPEVPVTAPQEEAPVQLQPSRPHQVRSPSRRHSLPPCRSMPPSNTHPLYSRDRGQWMSVRLNSRRLTSHINLFHRQMP